MAAPAKPTKPVCPAEVADQNAALVTARICGGPVAIAGMTNETDQAVATATGTVQWQHHYRPVRVRYGNGWKPVDTTLTTRANGTVGPAATAVDLTFSGGGTAPMVTITTGKTSLRVGSPVGALPKPVLAGATATYRNVLPGMDLQLIADIDGYSQVLVVKDRHAATNPKLAKLTFAVAGKNGTTSADKAGNLRVKDTTGATALAGNTPLMWDAPTQAATTNTTAAGNAGQRKAMRTTVSTTALTVTPDKAMLTDPSTVYPVYIDPGVTATKSGWSQVDSATPGTAYWNGAGDAQSGTSNGGTSAQRAFFNLDLAATPISGKYVTAASLELSETWSASCTAKQVDLYTTGTASSSTTWNIQPAWTTLQSSATAAKGFSGSCPAGPLSMDATAGVRAAATASAASVTLGVRATSETDSTAFKKFNNNPTLTITYTDYPTTSALSTSPSTPCVTGNTRPYVNTVTPLLQARISDPEGALVRPEFSWSTTAGTAIGSAQPTPGQASGQLFATTVPAGAFANNGSYSWKVRGFDGTVWGPWSANCEFTVDTTAPTAAPTVSSSAYPSGDWSLAADAAGSFSFGASGVSDVAAYLFGLDSEPITSVNASSLGGSATVSITPTADGAHTLKVQARDRGGNLSPTASYVFNVGSGVVNAPTTGATTASKVTLSGTSKPTSSSITYQWRRGAADSWSTVPSADVTTTVGAVVTWPVATTGSGSYPDVIWNVAATLNTAEAGTDPLDGPVQVRASFAGTSSGFSSPVLFKLDRDKTSAASAEVGPGSVNLLTGNFSLTASDAASGGIGIQRVFSSRRSGEVDAVFGPGWTSSVSNADTGSYTDLTVTGSLAQVGNADGTILGFTKSTASADGETFSPQIGAEGAKLTFSSTGDTSYTLTEPAGSLVTFTRRAGDPSGLYTPTTMTAAGVSQSTSVSWEKVTVGGVAVVRPTRVLAPTPTGVTCTNLLAEGCRALSMIYATSTSATGTANSTLGDYIGRIKEVTYTAWDPDLSTPAMRTVTLARYAYDTTGRLRTTWDPRLDYSGSQHVTTAYTYNADGTVASIAPPGQESWQFTYTTIPNDTGSGRLYKVSRSALSAGTAVQSVVYGVPISGSSAPVDMAANIARWGQTNVPADATSLYPPSIIPDGNPATGQLPSWPGDDRVSVTYMDTSGRQINAMQPGGAVNATWYDKYGNTVRRLTVGNLVRSLYNSDSDTTAQEAALSRRLSSDYVFSLDGQRLLHVLEPETDVVLHDFGTVRARAHTTNTYDEGAPTGGPYNLLTTEKRTVQYAVSGVTVDADARSTSYQYGNWSRSQLTAMIVDPAGLALTTRTAYDSDGRVTSVAAPAAEGTTLTAAVRQIVYYRAGTGSGYSGCDNKPRWATLTCRVQVAAQPTTNPEVPTEVTTYDLYRQPRTITETNSTSTLRSATYDYDVAGRPVTTTVSSAVGTAILKERTFYDLATGAAIETQSLDSAGNVVAHVARAYDTLGRQTGYTDADANVSITAYDLQSRPISTNDGKATQVTTYDGGGELRGLPTQVLDDQAGTFGATYDIDGNIATETRPDGLTVMHHYNERGMHTGIEYLTTSTCATAACTLYYEYVGRDRYDKVRWSASSLTSTGYGYDEGGKLTATNLTTSTCTLRAFKFDTASNRTRLVSYPPAAGGTCQDNEGQTDTWTYDTAARVNSAGYTYDGLGRTLTIPAKDSAGGTAAGDLTVAYYANDMAKSVTQGSTQTTYSLDVDNDRFRSYTSTTAGTTSTQTNHYTDDSDSPAWTGRSGSYTRYIAGLAGIAVLYTGASPQLEWKITNLAGDFVATRLSGAAGLSATHPYDEYGRPLTANTPAYGWQGSAQRSADNAGGIITMGARLYNPATGRFFSADSIYGGNDNAYEYCGADPVNCNDTDGRASVPKAGNTSGRIWAGANVCTSAQTTPGYVCQTQLFSSAVLNNWATKGMSKKTLSIDWKIKQDGKLIYGGSKSDACTGGSSYCEKKGPSPEVAWFTKSPPKYCMDTLGFAWYPGPGGKNYYVHSSDFDCITLKTTLR